MEFYYKSNIEILDSCPPNEYCSVERISYRWVFDDINNHNNFKAQADKNPKRLNDKSDMEKCNSFALSFHDTKNNSIKHFNYFLKLNRNIYKSLGTHIASGCLDKLDGLSGNIDKKGHFNFHHVKNHNFENKFKIILKL